MYGDMFGCHDWGGATGIYWVGVGGVLSDRRLRFEVIPVGVIMTVTTAPTMCSVLPTCQALCRAHVTARKLRHR